MWDKNNTNVTRMVCIREEQLLQIYIYHRSLWQRAQTLLSEETTACQQLPGVAGISGTFHLGAKAKGYDEWKPGMYGIKTQTSNTISVPLVTLCTGLITHAKYWSDLSLKGLNWHYSTCFLLSTKPMKRPKPTMYLSISQVFLNSLHVALVPTEEIHFYEWATNI